jgi:serine/threonine protein kinase
VADDSNPKFFRSQEFMPGPSSALVSRLSSIVSDRFRNIKAIGSRTTSSTVVSAIRIEDSLPVVIKYVDGPNGEREAAALRDNEHPNIIPLLDHFAVEGGSCLVLPLAPLGDLGAFMNSKRFTFLDNNSSNGWRSIVRQLVLPLQFLHSKGIIHNDIKVQNYVVFGTKTEPIIKLIDLGLACQDRESNVIGTIEYTAPEKFLRQPSSEKSDIWSLGVTVYVAFCGHQPFDARKGHSNHRNAMIARKVSSGNVAFDRKFWVEYPEAEEFIRDVLKPDPAERPCASDVIGHPILCSELST